MLKPWIVIIVCSVLVLPLSAEQATSSQDVKQYLNQLQIKLEHTAQRTNQPTAGGSSVVGLRGSKQEPLSRQLYWKGKKGSTPVSPEEIKMFRTAVEEAQMGQKAEALATLKTFQDKYPKSALKSDAQETIRVLSEPTPTPAAIPAH